MIYPEEFQELFWSRVLKTDGDECWLWQKGTTKSGYGQINARKISKYPMTCHRIAWELTYGPIPDGLHVLHECDNPPCCRPSHLFLGTQVINNEDRQKKGRTASGDKNGSRTKRERNPFVVNGGSGLTGQSHPMAKLSDEQVLILLNEFSAGASKAALARKYCISNTHIARLVYGRSRQTNAKNLLCAETIQFIEPRIDRSGD